jgi:hypothetical protein
METRQQWNPGDDGTLLVVGDEGEGGPWGSQRLINQMILFRFGSDGFHEPFASKVSRFVPCTFYILLGIFVI